jgi:hypothetical protein
MLQLALHRRSRQNRSGLDVHHEVETAKRLALESERLADHPPSPIAHDGTTDAACGGHPEARIQVLLSCGPGADEEHERPSRDPQTGFVDLFELRTFPQPGFTR